MRAFIMAALAAAGLVLAATSGVFAAPIAPVGKGLGAIDYRATAHYYGYGYHHRYHRHCWWRHGYRHCRW